MNITHKIMALGGLIISIFSPFEAMALNYKVTPLVSNKVGLAPHIDPNLINPWGLFFVPNGSFWVADNGSNLSTVYNPSGIILSPVITANAFPTGAKYNSASDNFLINNIHPARFIYSTENGTILGFNSSVLPQSTVVVIDKSATGAVYKGLEVVANQCETGLLFATDFHNNKIDAFNKNFLELGSFTDPNIPAGFAPFNIQQINSLLYVTYAKQLAPLNHDDEAGPGNGYVDVFNLSGNFVKRLISQGNLNSPWGLALAPSNFGKFSKALLVGNFGDGKINAYNISTGQFLGQVSDATGTPIVIDGLWSLQFNVAGKLFFSSGPNSEADGLVGTITPIP